MKGKVVADRSLDCGCRVVGTVDPGEVHIFACPNPQHEAMLTKVAADIAVEKRIDLNVVRETRPPDPEAA